MAATRGTAIETIRAELRHAEANVRAIRAALDHELERLAGPHLDGNGAVIGDGGEPVRTTELTAAKDALALNSTHIATQIALL